MFVITTTSLLLFITFRFSSADYVVVDLYSSDESCRMSGPLQASISREVGICWNLPPDMPGSFKYATKKSYRINSCANSDQFTSTSVSVFDERDCEGDEDNIDWGEFIPATCMGNVHISCQKLPFSLEQQWPSMDMWCPTERATNPNCSPNDHPPVIFSFKPQCALFENPMGQYFAMKTECSDGEMSLKLYDQVNFCPDDSVQPFWTTENEEDSCMLLGDVFEWGISRLPPLKTCCDMATHFGLSSEEQKYVTDLLMRSSVKFRCAKH